MESGRTDLDCRLAELLAALSMATALAAGQPVDHLLRSCLLGLRLAGELGASEGELVEVYYLSLLRLVGATGDSHEVAAYAGGDDLAYRAELAPLVMGERSELVAFVGGWLDPASGIEAEVERVAVAEAQAAGSEVAGRLGVRLSLDAGTRHAIRHTFERWDGAGHPAGLAAETIPRSARVAVLAGDVQVLAERHGPAAALDAVCRRRGRAYDPALCDLLAARGAGFLSNGGAEAELLDEVVAAEPGAPRTIAGPALDAVLGVFADFTDLKTPATLGHSTEVAAIAERAARHAGFPEAEVVRIRRAALVHDLGRVGVPNAIWEKEGALTDGERDRMRSHALLSQRLLERTGPLKAFAPLAGSHHERLDGSGYHRGLRGEALTASDRLLAAADTYQAMTQGRAHRVALPPSSAALRLRAEVRAGRLDAAAVDAVLATVGEPVPAALDRATGGDLTESQIAALRWHGRGLAGRDLAERLGVAESELCRRLAELYEAVGVSTRAGAAAYALEHGYYQH